jgi:hypothetical protein
MGKQSKNALHVGDFVVVTSDGDIIQSDNRHFSGKTIGNIDPSAEFSADEALKSYYEAFDQLVTERDQLLGDLASASDPEGLRTAFMAKASSAAAIGDFDNLLVGFPVAEKIVATKQKKPTKKAAKIAESEESKEVKTSEIKSKKATPRKAKTEVVVTEAEINADDHPEIHHDDALVNLNEVEDTIEEAVEEVAPAAFVPKEALFTEGDPHYPFEQLVLKAEELAVSSDWQVASHELDNIRFKWSELTPVSDEAQKELSTRLQQAQASFNERRSAHYEKMTQVRASNLVRKKELLERLETIVKDGRWNAINELKSLERRWEKIRQIPADEIEKLNKRFEKLKETFEEKRIDFLVKRKEREEENLTVKLLLLDKLDLINNEINEETTNWENLDKLFEGLSQQWRKVGPVVLEREDEIWERYRNAVETFQQKKLRFNKAYKAELDKNLKKKTSLVEQAEALLIEADLVNAARTINRLHREWKDVGAVAKEVSESLWERFKKASDAFNDRKNENLDVIRDAENKNYEAKEKLCEAAEALLNTDDYAKATKEIQQLSNQWREIGPVPRRKTKPIWNRFKKAMDDFFEKRRDSMRDSRKDEKENYRAKKEIIDKINKLLELEDPQQAVNEIKPLQAEYQKIGFVPMKYKNKLWAKYKEACDAIYQRAREERAARSIQKVDSSNKQPRQQRANANDGGQDRRKGNDAQRLKKECDELQQLILHYSDTKTFIKPSKQGNKLRDDIQAKIDAAQAKLYSKQEELEQLKRQAEAGRQA